jgi:hypothetical protein
MQEKHLQGQQRPAAWWVANTKVAILKKMELHDILVIN